MPLPWFRRKKPEDTAPITRAPETPDTEPLTVYKPAAEDAASPDEQSTSTTTKRRRRGTRGGRKRK